MTQTLDADARISRPDGSPVPATRTWVTWTKTSKFGTFAITFGIAFAVIYTFFERWNWPLFTYHPAVGKLDFGMQPARSGEGPPMYWYGWIVLTAACALVAGWIATKISVYWVQRATFFCCVLAALWAIAFALGVYISDRTSFDAEFYMQNVWMSAIPALLGAAAATYFLPSQWAQRAWTGWLLIMPIGGLVILAYSLKSFFVR